MHLRAFLMLELPLTSGCLWATYPFEAELRSTHKLLFLTKSKASFAGHLELLCASYGWNGMGTVLHKLCLQY